ncbi:Crp/Fnr family transcriptional regulator [Aestuariibacter sp. GS-14]|uniref:Crp/Fnr family transcriptional regulator n=1 Tax=Aestuariibacter sp. GS-14 TaxID=2590670 RepID=UPI00112934DC|nr:Crp/Fnr family transcriptional regulator [Aestuariibacter sp. GS-14]TPV59975.1 Crp/Fnr family transcriptional regulator [Aestuariibacter sp. GS-14]
MKKRSDLYEVFLQHAKPVSYQKRESILREGEHCNCVYLIEQGFVRSWFNDDGNDITFQFFFPGDIVTSFESMKMHLPSLYNIESISAVTLKRLTESELKLILKDSPDLNAVITDYLTDRLYRYQKLFISRIKNSPQRRYEELLEHSPEIFNEIPHHYIASYLGITPVSLSRIKNKHPL